MGSNEGTECNRRSSQMDQHGEKFTSKRGQLGRIGYDSGDSLEMDQGDDLRGELDGQHADNMDEEDRRQESHIASVVAKIKKEKNVEERIRIKEEPRDRDHRERINRKQEERHDNFQTRKYQETAKEDHHKREHANKEKEIFEREKL